MDLCAWQADELRGLRQRLAGGVLELVPAQLLREPVDGGGVAPIYVLWHLARHHDVAVNLVIRNRTEVLDGWAGRVGLTTDRWRGLAEAEDTELAAVLDPDAVGAYALAVVDASIAWLEASPDIDLGRVPDSEAALSALGTPADRFDWLYAMWDVKPVQFFLQWAAIGHGYVHLGELLSLRNRLGLSPF